MSQSKDAWYIPPHVRIRYAVFFDGAEDDGRPVVANDTRHLTAAELVEQMYTNIKKLVAEGEARKQAEMDAQILDERKHPIAPHPDLEWQERSRRVWRGMRLKLSCENAPWHHREIWEWAARTQAGVEWLEREIVFWEQKLAIHENRAKRWTASAKRRALTGEPADDDEIYWVDGPAQRR